MTTRLLLALALVAAAVLVECGNKTYQTHYDPPIPFAPDSKPSVLPFDDEIKGGGFSNKCRADLAKPGEMCTKELMERQQREETKR